MERIKSLNLYQKGILILMIAMSLIFAVIYPGIISKVGYRYNDVILVPTEEDGNTVYSGKIKGEEARILVSSDTVVIHYGDRTYGPYTVRDDATAVPKDNAFGGSMKGIEIREGNEIFFRGGVVDLGESYWLKSEDGTTDNMVSITYVTSDGIERDAEGNPVDRMKPTAYTIYELTHNPELTHKGVGFAWFCGALLCLMNAVSILFADELFRWNLSFQIRNADRAEPSELELAGRYIGWTAMVIMALVLYIMGLQ